MGSISKKIAIITSVHSVDDNRIFWREAVTLAKRFDVTVYGLRGPNVEWSPTLRTKVLDCPGGRAGRLLLGGRRLIKAALNDGVSIIHFHDPELIPIVRYMCAGRNVRLIFDNHEDYPHVMMSKDWLPRPIRPVVKRWMERTEVVAAREFDAVITPTNGLGARFAALGARSVVLKNYPPLLRDHYVQSAPISTRRTDFVHVGTVSLHRVELFAAIIEAVQKLRPESTWRFVGLGSQVSRALAERLGPLAAFVSVTPWLPPEKIPAELDSSRIGVNFHPDVPQFKRAIPVKVIEYMAKGLPVVTTPVPELEYDLPPALAEAVGVYITPHDVHAFARRCVEVAEFSENMHKSRQSEREAILLKRLSWEGQESRLFELYDELN